MEVDFDRDAILKEAVLLGASDILVTAGHPIMVTVAGRLEPLDGATPLTEHDTRRFAESFLSPAERTAFESERELDMRFLLEGVANFRLNIYIQRGAWGAAARIVPLRIPQPQDIGLPPHVVERLLSITRGLILVTGPTGAGKSTTIASLLQRVNMGATRRHIVTIEDPIEFTFSGGNSIIDQREVGSDTLSFASGLRGALRQLPHIIFVGEMRDLESVAMALSAAETGNLVISTMATPSAAQTVTRIIDSFPATQQPLIRSQLAMTLKAIVSQVLLPRADGRGRVAAREVLFANQAIQNLIREDKVHQIGNAMATSGKDEMVTLDQAMSDLVERGVVGFDVAYPWFEDSEKRAALQKRVYRPAAVVGVRRGAAS